MSRTVTVGSDAEFFLFHPEEGIVPATGFNTPGTKKSPVPSDYGSFHRDNILVELQPTAADNPKEFMVNAQRLYSQLDHMYNDSSMYMQAQPSASFSEEKLRMPEAHEIGCEPDFCAYSGEKMEPTKAEEMGEYRVGSGHIHIGGIEDFSELDRRNVVKLLDVMEGQHCSMQDADDPNGPMRRKFYGQAGRYRIKPYGVEWRTPSNLNWFSYTRRRGQHLFAAVLCAVRMTEAGILAEDLFTPEYTTQVRQAIDMGDYNELIGRMAMAAIVLKDNPVAMEIITEEESVYECRPSVFTV